MSPSSSHANPQHGTRLTRAGQAAWHVLLGLCHLVPLSGLPECAIPAGSGRRQGLHKGSTAVGAARGAAQPFTHPDGEPRPAAPKQTSLLAGHPMTSSRLIPPCSFSKAIKGCQLDCSYMHLIKYTREEGCLFLTAQKVFSGGFHLQPVKCTMQVGNNCSRQSPACFSAHGHWWPAVAVDTATASHQCWAGSSASCCRARATWPGEQRRRARSGIVQQSMCVHMPGKLICNFWSSINQGRCPYKSCSSGRKQKGRNCME